MGSWYDFLKRVKKPDYITIKPAGLYPHNLGKNHPQRLWVVFHYRDLSILPKTFIVDEVSLSLRGLGADVSTGEKWGDWGGAIKVGDVIWIRKTEKGRVEKEKVTFT